MVSVHLRARSGEENASFTPCCGNLLSSSGYAEGTDRWQKGQNHGERGKSGGLLGERVRFVSAWKCWVWGELVRSARAWPKARALLLGVSSNPALSLLSALFSFQCPSIEMTSSELPDKGAGITPRFTAGLGREESVMGWAEVSAPRCFLTTCSWANCFPPWASVFSEECPKH